MKKVLLTATVQSHIAQFHKPLIKMLKENGYEVHVAARDNLAEKNGLKLDESDKIFNIPFDRSPLSSNNIIAYQELKKILSENKYDIVHCNTPMGGVVTRLAAKKYRKKGVKVFYTAHGFHFYKGAPKKNWIIYYPIEKFLSRYTDKLITITKDDFNLAKDKFRTDVVHIHGVGANEDKYYKQNKYEIIKFREKLSFSKDDFLLLCTGELNANKNQSLLIKTMASIIKEDKSIKLLLAGNGPLESQLKNLVNKLDITKNVYFLGYKVDLENYVNICDTIISVSRREGLPLNIIEGMICEKPIIASSNRGHNELITEGFSGSIVDTENENDLKSKILYYKNNPDYLVEVSKNACKTAEKYSKGNVINELKQVYEVYINEES